MFNEANSVEDYVRDLLCGKQDAAVREPLFKGASLPALASGLGWQFIPADQLPRTFNDVLVEAHLRQALIRLNPEIAEKPDRADEVIYKLRAIILSVQSDGLVRANEEFTAWLRGERSMPFGRNNQHTAVRLVDFDNIGNNQFVCTQQLVVSQKKLRPDLVLFINGIPVVVCEAKTPVRPAISWVDGAADIYEDYEVNIPALFVSNVFSFATEGKTYRYGSIRMPLELWAPWRDPEQGELPGGLSELSVAVNSMLRPQVVLVTHFYSEKKNTDEMLKLLDILVLNYADQACIYFSWDAASWHASKRFIKRVEEINSPECRATRRTPLVKLAPLPSCAQFLNVIESVFSGMAKAIIHNSDYQSVDECKTAIDRYFEERNQHFKEHPMRAGKKIWGEERVPAVFNESNNCKDPRYQNRTH